MEYGHQTNIWVIQEHSLTVSTKGSILFWLSQRRAPFEQDSILPLLSDLARKLDPSTDNDQIMCCFDLSCLLVLSSIPCKW